MKSRLALVLLLLIAAPAGAAERYDPRKAGHPVRIIAYAAHPFGWLLDRLIFFPAWWIGGHEPFRSIVGHEGLPQDDSEVIPVEPPPLDPAADAPVSE
jgi:hypothetical protein